MQLGMIGLGRMGGNIVRRLMRGKHDCVVYDKSAEAVGKLTADGAKDAPSVAALVAALTKPRAVWIMLPAGAITDETVTELAGLLAPGDCIIDGGNSFYQDDIRRAGALRPRGIFYVDVGTSGGVWGLERGYCMMIGGDRDVVERLDPIFDYAEGFDILHSVAKADVPAERRYALDLADIAEVWRRGSVISSWLLDLTAIALAENSDLAKYSGFVEDSGEGRWTINAAIEQAVPADVLSAALYARFRSRQEHTFAERTLSAMRFQFGGHVEKKPSSG